MWIRVSDLELSENVYCDAIVEFRCTSRGYRGDYWNPPEGPQFEFIETYVDVAWGGHSTDNGWREVWCKGRQEMGDWVGILDAKLDQAIDEDMIYDRMCDELCNNGDY